MALIFKRGNTWYVDYCEPSGRRIRKAVSRYKETAQKALKKIEVEIAEGKYLDIRKRESMLFEDFAERYRHAHIRLENKSIITQECVLNGLVKRLQGKYMHEISTYDLKELVSERAKTVKPSTVNNDITMLKSMFNRANEWGVLNGHNPARDVKKLKENNERCRWLTEEEQERLLFYCKGVTRMLVLIALKTGLRWGEIITLRWKQAPQSNYVDFDNDTIFIHESLTKSKKSRYVPLAPSVKQALMDFPQHSDSGYIFINPRTGKLYDNVDKSFRSALREAKIKDLRFHDLRHCFASQLVRKGVDLYIVQKLLGHASPKMTQRYAHLRDDRLKEAISIIDEQNTSFSGLNADSCHNLVTSHSNRRSDGK